MDLFTLYIHPLDGQRESREPVDPMDRPKYVSIIKERPTWLCVTS